MRHVVPSTRRSTYARRNKNLEATAIESLWRFVALPERTRDTVRPGDVGGLEEGGSPSPLRDNDTSGQTSLDHTASGAVQYQGGRKRKLDKRATRNQKTQKDPRPQLT